MTRTPFILRNPSVLAMLAVLAVLTLAVTLTSQAYGTGALPTSTVKILGMTLCLALAFTITEVSYCWLEPRSGVAGSARCCGPCGCHAS